MDADDPTHTPPADVHDLPNSAPHGPTIQDPTADGHLCGALKSRHTRADDPDGWPYCLHRAGKGTEHVSVGRCFLHGGASPQAQRAGRLKLLELVDPALARLGRIIADDDVTDSVHERAVRTVLDRTGYPRRVEVDVEDARAQLAARLAEVVRQRHENTDGE